jgi:dGTPase
MQKENATEVLTSLGGLDPDVVEAAGLAHDLGHPPFGHIAEAQLQESCKDLSSEAFEGNAQSFRIVTKLAVRTGEGGSDLTLATLNAILKYPWRQRKKSHKWGVYKSEATEYQEARKAAGFKETKTLEAELMDWADDIAYAVYDLDDFYRAGLIPLDRLIENSGPQTIPRLHGNTLDRFFESVRSRWDPNKTGEIKDWDRYQQQFLKLLRAIKRDALLDPYGGTHTQRAALRDLTSFLVGRYANGIKLIKPSAYTSAGPWKNKVAGISTVEIDPLLHAEVTMLKQLTWTYVIENPALAAQQQGQRCVIKTLYERFSEAALSEDWNIFPSSLRTDLQENFDSFAQDSSSRARVIIDLIATMTEVEAIGFYQRLTGHSGTSVLHRILI